MEDRPIRLPGTLWTTLIVVLAALAQSIWGREPVLEILDQIYVTVQVILVVLLALAKGLEVAREESVRTQTRSTAGSRGRPSLFRRWLLG